MYQSAFASPQVQTIQVSAALETVRNVLLSLWALTAPDVPVAEHWGATRAAQLTPEQRHFNRLLFAAFGAALLPEETYPDFATYLDAWAAQPVAVLHPKLVQAVAQVTETDLRQAAEAQLADPVRLQQEIVEHLNTLWEGLLAGEWQRHTPSLAGMTRTINELVLSQPRWQAIEAGEALRTLLQTEPTTAQYAQLAGVKRITLIWSLHLPSYCHRMGSPDTLWVLRKIDPQLMRREPLRRAEVLTPLTALADETRLRILELLTEQGELRAQELIAQLESSQGNVSRHLKQLANSGFIRERRAGDANKIYTIEPAGLQRLIFLTRQLLSPYNAQAASQQQAAETRLQTMRASVPPLLQEFVDEQGRITRWSPKRKEQQAILEYLLSKFAQEQSYSEKEVNALLQAWYLDADFVLVRRSLIDAGLLRRTKDGARYWRAESSWR